MRVWSGVLGVGFLVVGVLRLVPVAGLEAFAQPEPVHGVLHLVSGAAFLRWGARRPVPGVVAGLGVLWVLLGALARFGLLDHTDAYVHIGTGVGSVGLGAAAAWRSRAGG